MKNGKPRAHMKALLLYLPERHISDLDNLVDRKLYANRNEAIRAAVRDLLVNESWPHAEETP